jgi:hypothetical protein
VSSIKQRRGPKGWIANNALQHLEKVRMALTSLGNIDFSLTKSIIVALEIKEGEAADIQCSTLLAIPLTADALMRYKLT